MNFTHGITAPIIIALLGNRKMLCISSRLPNDIKCSRRSRVMRSGVRVQYRDPLIRRFKNVAVNFSIISIQFVMNCMQEQFTAATVTQWVSNYPPKANYEPWRNTC